jgi:non-ribosomal peptide synthetase component F
VYISSFKNDEHGILSSLKLWVCSGEPLPMSLAKQFLDTFSGHTLCNFYGSTEIMGDVSYYAIKSFSDLCFGDKVPIGQYYAAVKIITVHAL